MLILTWRVEHHWRGVSTLPSQPYTGGTGDMPAKRTEPAGDLAHVLVALTPAPVR